MTFDWQNLIVLLIVAAAAVYVARLAWTSIVAKRANACGGCRNCATSEKTPEVFNLTSQPMGKQSR